MLALLILHLLAAPHALTATVSFPPDTHHAAIILVLDGPLAARSDIPLDARDALVARQWRDLPSGRYHLLVVLRTRREDGSCCTEEQQEDVAYIGR